MIGIDSKYKVGSVFLMVICSEFRLRQYRGDDRQEDAPHFINATDFKSVSKEEALVQASVFL